MLPPFRISVPSIPWHCQCLFPALTLQGRPLILVSYTTDHFFLMVNIRMWPSHTVPALILFFWNTSWFNTTCKSWCCRAVPWHLNFSCRGIGLLAQSSLAMVRPRQLACARRPPSRAKGAQESVCSTRAGTWGLKYVRLYPLYYLLNLEQTHPPFRDS